MKNTWISLFLFPFVIFSAETQAQTFTALAIDELSSGATTPQTTTLAGDCSDGSDVVISDSMQELQAPCSAGRFSQEIFFQNLGMQDLILSQQINENLAMQFRMSLVVIEDADTTPPALSLIYPANSESLNRTTTLTGTCEVGLTVHYRAGSTDGSFECTSENFSQPFVFPELGNYNFYLRQIDEAGNDTITRTWVRVSEDPAPTPEPEPEPEPTPEPEEPAPSYENRSSGGSLSINGVRASRLECTSPCPVVFSLDRMTDSSSSNPFVSTGVYWNYGDVEADERLGRFERGSEFFRNGRRQGEGASRESDTNTPIGMHTYHCESGTCTFRPGVTVRNANGDWATEWLTVTVRAADTQYSATQTVCISSSSQWDGDQPCPEGATQMSDVPSENNWQSNTRYLLRRGDVFSSSCIAYNNGDIIIDDFGNTADSAPEMPFLGIGHDGRCSDTIPTNQTIANYNRRHWVENITVSDLRVAQIDVGMSFKDLTFNHLDMDYENQAAGGTIRVVSADACSRNSNLDCSNIPNPEGFYISGTRIIGSRQSLPGVNVSLMSSACVSFFGLIDSELEIAYEHNVRLECASRVIALHNDLKGNHLGTNGNKHALTVRPDGYLNEDMLGGMKRDTSVGKANFWDNRFVVALGNYLGTPESVNNSARITFTASNGNLAETTRYGLITRNISDLLGGSGDGPSPRDASLQGVGLACYSDNIWSPTGSGCRDHGQRSVPSGFYEEAEENMTPPAVPNPPSEH